MTEGFDPQALLSQALEMQQRLAAAQSEAASETVEGSSGGGAVKIVMTGGGEVTSVRIAPSAVDPSDVEMLEDLVLAAFHDAFARAAELAQSQMGASLGDLLGGGGLGDLFGALAGGADPQDALDVASIENPPTE
jgi:DNA-binding YbaB/EbfC family protein